MKTLLFYFLFLFLAFTTNAQSEVLVHQETTIKIFYIYQLTEQTKTHHIYQVRFCAQNLSENKMSIVLRLKLANEELFIFNTTLLPFQKDYFIEEQVKISVGKGQNIRKFALEDLNLTNLSQKEKEDSLKKENIKLYKKRILAVLQKRDADSLKIMIENGLNPNQLIVEKVNWFGKDTLTQASVLMYAVFYTENLDLIKLMINKGADVWQKGAILVKENYFLLENSLMIAAHQGKVNFLKYFLEELGMPIEYNSSLKSTPLTIATASGQSETLKYLLQKGANINHKNIYGNTPLMLAAIYGHTETLRFLISKQANIFLKNNNGYSALMLAINFQQLENVKALLENGANVNEKIIDNWQPIFIAAKTGNLDIVKIIVEKGGKLTEKLSENWTLLHIATYYGHIQLTKYLIEQNLNVNERIKDGTTALMLAAQKGQIEIVKILIENKVNVNMRNSNGHTALIFASANNYKEIVELLVVSGANTKVKDNARRKAIDCAKNEEIKKALRKSKIEPQ